MFLLLTIALAAVIIAAMVFAYRGTRDVFHPALVIGPMLLFLYVYMPLRLVQEGTLRWYLSDDHAAFAQLANLVGSSAFLVGIILGQRSVMRLPAMNVQVDAGRVFTGALVLGIVGLLAFGYTLAFVGGLSAAYGDAYGGGTAGSGYVRDAVLLTLPAALLLLSLWRSASVRLPSLLLCAAFVMPHVIHAVLGARRGPAFMVLIGTIGGWYLANRRRPGLTVATAGGFAVGLLMLILVANRSNIHLGSDWSLKNSPAEYLSAGTGNEFLFGAATIVTAEEREKFTWGGRYLTILLVRPIPRQLWPTKYDDAAELFGTASMEVTAGIDPESFSGVVGWRGALGSAPGLVADLWTEFSWASALVLLGIGWAFGRAWARERASGGFSSILYGILISLSVYLIMQTVEALLFRLLVMALPSWLVWRWATLRSVGPAANGPLRQRLGARAAEAR